MKHLRFVICAMWSLTFTLASLPALAADYPAPKEGSWVVRDFRSDTGGRRWRREYLVLLQPAGLGTSASRFHPRWPPPFGYWSPAAHPARSAGHCQ